MVQSINRALRPVRVIMLSEYPYDESEQGLGGILQATFQLIEGFRALDDLKGLELHVVTFTRRIRRATHRQVGPVTCHYIPRGESLISILVFSPIRLLIYFAGLCWQLKPRLVHGQGTVTFLLLSILFGERSIQTVHGIYRNENSSIPRDQLGISKRTRFLLKNILERFYLGRIRNLIAITGEIESVVKESVRGRFRAFRINNAIDTAFFVEPQTERSRHHINLLFVAAITPRKGLHVLLDAYRRLVQQYPLVHLTCVGTWDWAPSYVNELRVLYSELERTGSVEFTGSVSRERIVSEFMAADVLVLPSLSESAPMVISQAMSAGLAVVATRVGGVPEMVEDGVTGLLVEPNNPDALYGALERLIRHPEQRAQLGKQARSVAVVRYNPLAVAASTRDAYIEVMRASMG